MGLAVILEAAVGHSFSVGNTTSIENLRLTQTHPSDQSATHWMELPCGVLGRLHFIVGDPTVHRLAPQFSKQLIDDTRRCIQLQLLG